MDNFIFHNPTKIIFGKGSEQLIGEELKAAGVSNLLLLYGRESARKSGLLARVIASLKQSGISFSEFGGVVSNPTLSHTREGIALARRSGAMALLAVGGGSVIDEAKAIAVGAKASNDVWEFFLGRKVETALPVFTVLTLAASGSEMNGNAVITNEETKQKYNISTIHAYPRVSILNPELTHSVPPDYSAYGAVDAIAHLMEAYFTKELKGPDTSLQDQLVEGLLKTIMASAETIKERPSDAPARATMMWAATLALNGLSTAGVGSYSFPNHLIEHSLSALYDIPHGAGLSIVIPAWMRWYQPQNPAQFARFAREIFALSTGHQDQPREISQELVKGAQGAQVPANINELGQQGIMRLKAWFSKIGSPVSLREAKIPLSDIGLIAENAHGLAIRWGIERIYSVATITEILRLAATGENE